METDTPQTLCAVIQTEADSVKEREVRREKVHLLRVVGPHKLIEIQLIRSFLVSDGLRRD